MHEKSCKGLRDTDQQFKSKVSWTLPEPAIFVTDPMSKTEVKSTKYFPHLRLRKFAVVIDPPSEFYSRAVNQN